jgi:hypothetical protein
MVTKSNFAEMPAEQRPLVISRLVDASRELV